MIRPIRNVLDRFLKLTSVKVRLVSGRSIGQGKGKELGKFSQLYFESVAVCELSSHDMKLLDMPEGGNIRVKTAFGDVALKAYTSKQSLPEGVAFIPYGPWANRVTDPETHGSGMPSLKGIEAELSPALKEEVPTLDTLVKSLRSGK
jgi:formylmethanofuran dehydrogenase subunit D